MIHCPETIFTAEKRNCVFQLINPVHKAPRAPGPSPGPRSEHRRSRIPQVPPRLETKLPIVPKVLPVNSGPLNSPPALWAPWENPAFPRKHPAMIKGPAPQQKLGCKFPHEVLGATGREGRRPLRGARGPAHDHLTSGEEGPPAVCPPGGVWGASVPEPCCQAWSLGTHERFRQQ